MSPKEKHDFVKNVRRLFSKTNETRVDAGVNLAIYSHKYGFFNSLLESAKYIIDMAPHAIVTTLMVNTFWVAMNYIRNQMPDRQLRREVDTVLDTMQYVYPGLNVAVHRRDSEITRSNFLQRVGRGTRHMLRYVTFGISEVVIHGAENVFDWLMERPWNPWRRDYVPTYDEIEFLMQGVQEAIDRGNAAVEAVQTFGEYVANSHIQALPTRLPTPPI